MNGPRGPRRDGGTAFPVLPAAVGVAGLVVLAIVQLGPVRGGVEDRLGDDSRAALAAAGLGHVQVSFAGRDATVTAPRAQTRKAVDVVEGVGGVRIAHGSPVAEPAPTPTEAPTEAPLPAHLPIGLSISPGRVVAGGSVPDEATRDAVLGAAASGGRAVADRLEIDPSLAGITTDVGRLADLVRAVPGNATIAVRYDDETVILRGRPASGAVERRLLGAAASTVGDRKDVVDGLDVSPGAG